MIDSSYLYRFILGSALVDASDSNKLLFAICPVTRTLAMMCHCGDPQFIRRDLIDNAVGKSAQGKAASSAAKDRADQRIFQNEVRGSFELGHERKPEFDIRFRCIESRRVMQLGERGWNNDELHFNAART
jgi:hypothetical protein